MRRYGFTIIELLVVIIVLILLLTMMLPSLRHATEGTKHITCMTNMRQLSMGWINYANDHHSRLVNGEGGIWRKRNGVNETPWVGRCWDSKYRSGGQMSEKKQIEQIRAGALYNWTQDIRIYRCPTGYDGEMLTYAAMDSMYGRTSGRGNVFKPGVYIRKLFEIPRASQRALFIDEGWVTPDSYAVYFNRQKWWDDAPIRHGSGTTLAFADGHAERWVFESDETVQVGEDRVRGHPSQKFAPQSEAACYDLYKMQIATWGRLDYKPRFKLGVFDLKPTVHDPK